MTAIFDKLKLTSQERRLVMVVAFVLFIVVNVWFVWPHRKDWGVVQKGLEGAQKQLEMYRAEVARLPKYKAEMEALQNKTPPMLTAEQGAQLLRIVQTQAQRTGINATSLEPQRSMNPPSLYFEEQILRIQFNQTGDKELLNFLVALSAENSAIRVRDLDVKPDQSGMKLTGTIVVVANQQKEGAPAAGADGKPAPPPKK